MRGHRHASLNHISSQIGLERLHKDGNLVLGRIFRAHGYAMTREQEAILRVLKNSTDINQAELAARSGQERNNLSRTLNILEGKGLVSRQISSTDRRNCIIRITPEGKRLYAAVHKAMEEYHQVLFAGFSREEIDELANLVHRLTKNLETYLYGGEAVTQQQAETEDNGKPIAPSIIQGKS